MTFAELHRPGEPFVLPNAWDVGSARALAAAGFAAIGTTSLGVAAAQGLPDATRATRSRTAQLASDLVAAGLGRPVTCDVEDGFADDPGAVAEFVASLGGTGTGVAGINIEDVTAGELIDPERQVAKIRAIKRRSPQVFVNARTDTYWLGGDDLPATLDRLHRYVDAGADGVFVPGHLDERTIAALAAAVGVPLNVLAAPELGRDRLAALGVARISTGSLLYRVALGQAVAAAAAVRDGRTPPPAMGYEQVQAMNSGRVEVGQD